MSPNPLILDTDGGVDDAQALLMLIGNERGPFAITTVFGNVGLLTATRNILATLAVAGFDAPVHRGAALPLNQPIVNAKHIHGEDGLGGARLPTSIGQAASPDAIGFLRETLRNAHQRGEKVDLLMLGPLTNLAIALRLDPQIVEGIGRLTIMGGTLHGRGNTTPAAEFNIYADPEAAGIVLSSAIATTIVPWETCVAHRLSGLEVDDLFASVPDSRVKTLSFALAAHARRTLSSHGEEDAMRFVDPLAAAIAIEDSIVMRSIIASVDVALAPGITRGMTVVDPGGRLGTPPVRIIEQAKLDRLVALYAKSIGQIPSTH